MFDPYFWTIAVLAVFIVALSKAGLPVPGLVGVPLLALVMPVRDAAGMMLPLLLVMDAIGLVAYRREVDWKIVRIMLPGAIAGTVIGWLTFSIVTDAMVALLVGVVTVLFVLDTFLPLRKKLADLPLSKSWGAFWGGVSGFTSFVSHTGGPPFQVYVLPRKLSPAVFAGTTAWFFAIVNIAKLIPYWTLGQLSVANLAVAAILVPVGIAGMLIGIWAVRRIDAKLFYRLAYGLVFLLGLKLCYDGVAGMFFAGPVA